MRKPKSKLPILSETSRKSPCQPMSTSIPEQLLLNVRLSRFKDLCRISAELLAIGSRSPDNLKTEVFVPENDEHGAWRTLDDYPYDMESELLFK